MKLFDFISGRRDAVRAVWEVRRAVLNRYRAENVAIMSACAVHGPPLKPPPTSSEVVDKVRKEFESISGTRDGDGVRDLHRYLTFFLSLPLLLHHTPFFLD